MNIRKLNQKGFSIGELLLLLIILIIIGFVGWYVWQSQQKANKNYDDAAQGAGNAQKTEKKAAEKKAAEPADPTADWLTYTNKEGSFSFKYPKTWVQAEHPELCTPTIALFAANAASVGKCATESFGQMSWVSQEGNQLGNCELDAAHYPDLTTEAVTVNGVGGKKQTGTYKAGADDIGPGPQTGDKIVRYTFFTNNRTYYASYAVQPAYPDVLSDFNTLMTKTFKFTP